MQNRSQFLEGEPELLYWKYIQHKTVTARAAPEPTLSRTGLQYCHFSCFFSDSVSFCFICWTFCAVPAILSSRCLFLSLAHRRELSSEDNMRAVHKRQMLFKKKKKKKWRTRIKVGVINWKFHHGGIW